MTLRSAKAMVIAGFGTVSVNVRPKALRDSSTVEAHNGRNPTIERTFGRMPSPFGKWSRS
jgi:hypothetical protein